MLLITSHNTLLKHILKGRHSGAIILLSEIFAGLLAISSSCWFRIMVSCFPKHLMISVSLRLCSLEMYPWNSLRSCCLGEPVGCFAFALIRYQSIYPICYFFNAYFSLYFSQCPNRVILSHNHVSDLAFIINMWQFHTCIKFIVITSNHYFYLPLTPTYLFPPPKWSPFHFHVFYWGVGRTCVQPFLLCKGIISIFSSKLNFRLSNSCAVMFWKVGFQFPVLFPTFF